MIPHTTCTATYNKQHAMYNTVNDANRHRHTTAYSTQHKTNNTTNVQHKTNHTNKVFQASDTPNPSSLFIEGLIRFISSPSLTFLRQ